MITLITGAPGAGKTAALVDLLREIEASGRAIYVDGIPELQVKHFDLADPRQWMTEVPDGAAVVIDEVQRIWRPAGTGAKVAPDVAALETHRHKGLDFFVVTQHPNLLHANVRRLVGRHIHLRDVGLLGRWWYEWPEATDPATFRGAPIKKAYRLPKRVFGTYKSASLHVKPIRSVPRSVLVLGAALVAFGVLGFKAYASIDAKLQGGKDALAVTAAASPQKAASAATAQPAASAPLVEGPARIVEAVGCIAMPTRCTCFDARGLPMAGIETELCRVSASGFGGLVPLQLGSSSASSRPASAPAPVQHESGAIVSGFDAGDFRQRKERRPVPDRGTM